jgi:hypothetical protein
MVSERELWACAQQVLRQHGAGADDQIAERVRALGAAGDQAGVATWLAIAARVDQLRDHAGVGHTRQ